MKNLRYLIRYTMCCLVLAFFVDVTWLPAQESDSYRSGDLVEVDYFGTWLRGEVSKVYPGLAVVVEFRHPEIDELLSSHFKDSQIRAVTPSKTATRRTWTSSNGKFKIDATFQSIDEDNVFLKKSTDGEIVTVPLDKLSDSDRKYLDSLTESESPFTSSSGKDSKSEAKQDRPKENSRDRSQQDDRAASNRDRMSARDRARRDRRGGASPGNRDRQPMDRSRSSNRGNSPSAGGREAPSQNDRDTPPASNRDRRARDRSRGSSPPSRGEEDRERENRKDASPRGRAGDRTPGGVRGLDPRDRIRNRTSSKRDNERKVVDRRLGFEFLIPEGFDASSDRSDADVIYRYADRDESDNDAASFLQIRRLKRKVEAGKDIDLAELAADQPELVFKQERMQWNKQSMQIIQSHDHKRSDGFDIFMIQFPLGGESIQIEVGGPMARNREHRKVLEAVVDSFKTLDKPEENRKRPPSRYPGRGG